MRLCAPSSRAIASEPSVSSESDQKQPGPPFPRLFAYGEVRYVRTRPGRRRPTDEIMEAERLHEKRLSLLGIEVHDSSEQPKKHAPRLAIR